MIETKDQILKFISRFKEDCNWTNGNCYYFAVILKARFPDSEIYYDVIPGHFITKIGDSYWDWKGENSPQVPIPWETFIDYDRLQWERIIKDCIIN